MSTKREGLQGPEWKGAPYGVCLPGVRHAYQPMPQGVASRRLVGTPTFKIPSTRKMTSAHSRDGRGGAASPVIARRISVAAASLISREACSLYQAVWGVQMRFGASFKGP